MGRLSKRTVRKSVTLGQVVSLEDRVVPATAFALLPSNSLISFSTENPGAINPPVAVTNLGAGENLVGIDFRPQNGQLYGLATTGTGSVRLYAISQRTGFATPLSAPVQFDNIVATVSTPVPITGTAFGFDFNPVVDRIRVTTDTGFNFRMNPNTGALIDFGGDATDGVQPDTAINGGVGGPVGADAAGYTNSFPNATLTSLYHLDATTNTLFEQAPPNSGTATEVLTVTLNGAPLDFTAVNGFDIPSSVAITAANPDAVGRSFASLTTATTGTRLYGIELSTGVATDLGPIADGTVPYNGLAIQNDLGGVPTIALSADGTQLVRSNTATPGTFATVAVGALTVGEVLVAIDFRPQNGQLFGLGIDATNDRGTLYRIDPQTGAVTPIGAGTGLIAYTTDGTVAVDLPAATAGYGFDFNPTVDRIRITAGGGFNARANPNTGAAVDGNNGGAAMSVIGDNPDGPINSTGVGGPTSATAAAYTNSFGQPLAPPGLTSLYHLDEVTNTLFEQSPPNSGTAAEVLTVTLGGATLDFTAVNGFDIAPGVAITTANPDAVGRSFAALTVGGVAGLYSIELSTGVATFLGPVSAALVGGSGGLTVSDTPTGEVAFSAPTFVVAENGTATVTLTRTGGSSGAFTVNVAATGGTATPVTDFGTVPTTVTFADGQTTATFTLPIVADTLIEGDETIVLTLSAPTNGAVLAAQATTTLTITDDDFAGTVQFSSATYSGAEGVPTAIVTLTRTGGTAGTVTVLVSATGGTATIGSDFTGVPATVTFLDGQTTATLTLPILDDATLEGDETATLTLSAPTGGATLGAVAVATLTITDNDVAGTVQFSSATYSGAEGVPTATVTLTRTGSTAGTVTVSVNATGGTANSSDFTGVPTAVTFLDGQATATVVLTIVDDIIVEGVETATLTLSAPTGGATLGTQATTALTITDNDVTGTVQFSSATYSGAEGVPTATVTLIRTGSTAGTVTVTVSATGGTANSSDFTGVPTTVTFLNGQTTATVVLTILDDATVEGIETATLTLSTGNATLGTLSAATLTITDNDVTVIPPSVPTGPFLVGGQVSGNARLITGSGGSFSLGGTIGFPGLSGVTRVAVGDLNGDGTPDYIGGAAPGGPSRVVAIDGRSNAVLFSIDVFEASFTGGVFVAVGDLTGDGRAEVVVTPDQGGGPVVVIYSGAGVPLTRFFGIDDAGFRGGARAAVGDLNGDGRADLTVVAGFGGGPRVALFNGRTVFDPLAAVVGAQPPKLRPDFFVFEQTLRNGVFVASGDLNNDGAAELIVGGGPGGGPRVLALNGRDLTRDGSINEVANFFSGDSSTRGGVRLAVRDANGDGRPDLITGSGDSLPGRVRVYNGTSFPAANGVEPAGFQELIPFDDATLLNGVFVG